MYRSCECASTGTRVWIITRVHLGRVLRVNLGVSATICGEGMQLCGAAFFDTTIICFKGAPVLLGVRNSGFHAGLPGPIIWGRYARKSADFRPTGGLPMFFGNPEVSHVARFINIFPLGAKARSVCGVKCRGGTRAHDWASFQNFHCELRGNRFL